MSKHWLQLQTNQTLEWKNRQVVWAAVHCWSLLFKLHLWHRFITIHTNCGKVRCRCNTNSNISAINEGWMCEFRSDSSFSSVSYFVWVFSSNALFSVYLLWEHWIINSHIPTHSKKCVFLEKSHLHFQLEICYAISIFEFTISSDFATFILYAQFPSN